MKILLKKASFIIGIMVCLMNMQCEDEDVLIVNQNCDQVVIINETLYENLETDFFTFGDVKIIDNCLSITIGASGCSGDSWKFNLIDSGAVAESSPEQRYLKFALENNEDCLAALGGTISFDLAPLQVNGSNEIILNLEGLESSLNYKY